MAHQLTVITTLTEDTSLILGTQFRWLTSPVSSSLGNLMLTSGLCGNLYSFVLMQYIPSPKRPRQPIQGTMHFRHSDQIVWSSSGHQKFSFHGTRCCHVSFLWKQRTVLPRYVASGPQHQPALHDNSKGVVLAQISCK